MTGVVLCLFLALGLASGCKKKKSAPIRSYGISRAGGEIVARVGDRRISGRELAQSVHAYSQSLLQRGQKPPPGFEDTILDILIESELLYQAGREMEIPDLESRTEEMYREIASRFASPRMLAEALSRDGMTPDALRESLRKKVVIEAFLQEKVYSRLQVSEEEIELYYRDHRREMEKPERIRIRQIQLTLPRAATADEKEEFKNRAEELKERIEEGDDFSELARQFSDSPEKQAGGDMGFFTEGQLARLDPALEKAAWSLKPGEVSEPIPTRIGYHLLELEERVPAGVAPLEECREEIAASIIREKTPEELDLLISEIKKEIPVEKLKNLRQGEKE